MDEMWCVAYILLKNKQETTYYKLVSEFKSASKNEGFEFNVSEKAADYETANINAFSSGFNTTIKGCLFHHEQCLLKHIKSLKLYIHYFRELNCSVRFIKII